MLPPPQERLQDELWTKVASRYAALVTHTIPKTKRIDGNTIIRQQREHSRFTRVSCRKLNVPEQWS
jgi:hypothetical protein